MRVLISFGLLEMERAVTEVQDASGLLSPAGLAGGRPGEMVMLIFHFPCYGLELMKTSNGKKEKYRIEKNIVEGKCKHAKRQDLLVEQEMRGEVHVCKRLGSLSWPARPLQIKEACCSVLQATKTFQGFIFYWEKCEKYMYVPVKGV
ncbi:hypothetical protein WISP_92141 [Willisornis vidua]|uniref:Uncharacterized protein n=1 Tax=Willisornis vidua TaxID=1566151 RepID=A0ABQ9D1M7_9PASS|nr:hypothetical protein WISP_92141 [Willisornis vidua]